jgi:hypothetical protein
MNGTNIASELKIGLFNIEDPKRGMANGTGNNK